MSNNEKRIYGIIGYPVKHSLSPAMHNAAFRALGLNAEYRLFEVKPEELKSFLEELGKKNIWGLNVTIPHKVPLLIKNKTTITERSCVLCGAVNTIKREGGKLEYYNTDMEGFMNSLREDLKFDIGGKNVLIFGCGGAGRAIIAGLTTEATGIGKIYIYDLDEETVKSTKTHFDNFDERKIKLEFISEKQIADKIKDSNLLVNASPVGMKEGDNSVIDKKLLHKELSVYDVVYNRETQLVKDAKELLGDSRAVGGFGMLLYQGMLSFEIWTRKRAPKKVMEKVLLEALKSK